MGAKVNPNGLRFGINKEWHSRWVAKDNKEMAQWLVQDDKIRNLIVNKYKNAWVDRVEIERTQKSITLFIYASQPGLIIGNEGSELKKLTLQINKIVGRHIKVVINVNAIENPDLSARIVAREIADAIENRVSFRNAQKFAMKKVLRAGAKGVKTHVSGRLGGVEMAREEGYSQGVVTLSTLRTDIDYALEEANTAYGIIGVKVWINRGEIFKKDLKERRANFDKARPFNKKDRQDANPSKPRNPRFDKDGSKKPDGTNPGRRPAANKGEQKHSNAAKTVKAKVEKAQEA